MGEEGRRNRSLGCHREIKNVLQRHQGSPRPYQDHAPRRFCQLTAQPCLRSINSRWREHFSTLLNRPSTVDPTVLDQIPQKPVITSLDLSPTIDEVSKAIRQTSSGNSPGMDRIPAESFKSAGPGAFEALHSFLTSIWEEEDVPKEFRNAIYLSVFKNRGSETDCGNFRGISLLSVAGRILAWVILNRLITNISEENLSEAQCGFRPNRSTSDMIPVRQVQVECIDQNMDLAPSS